MKNLLIVSFCLFSLNSLAFTLTYPERARLPSNEVSVDVASNSCAVAGFNTSEEFLAFVERAVDEYWNKVGSCALKLKKGVVNAADTSAGDLTANMSKATVGTILIGCSSDGAVISGTTLGIASINRAPSDRGLVLLNNVSTNFANLTEQEKLATIAHEIGHAFGLGHSSDDVALMFYSVGTKVQERLTIDDFDGCTYLYPHDSPGSCSSVALVDKDGSGGTGAGMKNMFTFLIGLLMAGLLGILGKKFKFFL